MINKKLVRPRIMSDAFSRNMEEEKNKCVYCGKKLEYSHTMYCTEKCKKKYLEKLEKEAFGEK